MRYYSRSFPHLHADRLIINSNIKAKFNLVRSMFIIKNKKIKTEMKLKTYKTLIQILNVKIYRTYNVRLINLISPT